MNGLELDSTVEKIGMFKSLKHSIYHIGFPPEKMNLPSLLLLSNNEANYDKPLDSWMPYGTVPPF